MPRAGPFDPDKLCNSGVHCPEMEETQMKSWTKAFGPKTVFRAALLLSGLALSACAEPGPYYASYSGYDYYPGYDYGYYGYGPAVGFDFRSGGFRHDNFHRTHGEQRALLAGERGTVVRGGTRASVPVERERHGERWR